MMNGLKLRSILLTGLSILFCGLNVVQGVAQSEFPFFVPPQWSYDGNRIAVVEGMAVVTYDAASGAMLNRLEGHTDTILSVAWSPVDNRLASASADQTVKVWDGNNGMLLQNLTGHNDAVGQVIWSPDGTQLINHWC